MAKLFLFLGSINAFLTVVLGAFGAHFLKERLAQEMMAAYNTAVQYHMYHALALLIVGVIAVYLSNSSMLKWSGCLMLFGIILFSGSLYLLVFTGIKWFGIITPFGGVALIMAWVLFAVSVLRDF